MYIWSKGKKIIVNKQKIIIANTENGKWLRTTTDTYIIIEKILKEKLCVEEIEFEVEEDAKYINNVIIALREIGAIFSYRDVQKGKYSDKQVSIELTNNCNLRCIHCCVNAGEVNKADLNTDDILKILEKCVMWNPSEISLSGGEPLLRKDFFEVLSYLRKIYKGYIILSTNGTLINERNVSNICKNVDQIDISLDGVNEETCKPVRGKGVFGKVMNSIVLLHNNNFQNISLSMVTASKNEKYEDEFRILNKECGTRPILRMFAEVGRGKESKTHFLEEVNESIYIPKQFLDGDFAKETLGVRNCQAGRKELFIRYNGDVFPCPNYMDKQYLLGNILEVDDLNSLTVESQIDIDKSMKKIDMLFSDKCKDCVVSLFCWTCPSEAYRIKNKKLLDEYCNKRKPVLIRKVWDE